MPLFIVLAFCFLILTNCAGPQHRCNYPYSEECLQAEKIWQDSIDSIVLTNFPNEFGKYKAVVWEDDFDNAWVVKGKEINITKTFLYKLKSVFRKCVVAHELAHLKMGHHYAKSGIIILGTPKRDEIGVNRVGHYGQTLNIQIPRGFGEDQEKEADRLALLYIERAGIDKQTYLDSLLRLGTGQSKFESNIFQRIKYIKKIIQEEQIIN